ncbi:hypothetical protein C8R14_15410, partial [Nitrosomonas eutropha]
KRYYYDSHDQLKAHLHRFVMAYNFAKRLKALKGLTPYEYICKIWKNEPDRFIFDPFQHTVGLNSYPLFMVHRHPENDVINQVSSRLRHAPPVARGAKSTPFAEKRPPVSHGRSLYNVDIRTHGSACHEMPQIRL